MKQLFIPELGTEFVLAEDWKFPLYAEQRNQDLFDYFNYTYKSIYATRYNVIYSVNEEKKYQSHLEEINEIVRNLELTFRQNQPKYKYPNISLTRAEREQFNKEFWASTKQFNQDKVKEVQNSVQNYMELHKLKWNLGKVDVELWESATLIIDRIYIRENQASYSSVSFFIKDIPIKKPFKKYARFWAKLEDVNRILYR